MALSKNYKEIRAKAIEWLKSQDKDFKGGLTILQESGYKPTVATNIAKWGESSRLAKGKLLHVMYSLVGAWAEPDSSKHDDENPTDGTEGLNQEPEPLEDESVKKLCDDQGYPDVVRRVIHEFYALMKERTALKKEADKIEGDGEEINEARKTAYEKIEAVSIRMDTLWKAKTLFEKAGTLPAADLFEPAETPADKKDEGIDLASMDIEALKTLKKNEASKLTKARNMLEYQSEKKLDAPNPIPESPKRLKYEKKVEEISAFIEKIDYAIVAKS
jgi:FtsZ-binding cell division protein ZapB